MPVTRRTAERVIARLARRSHGVVTRRALLAAGVSKAEIEHRLGTGSLLREYKGIYRVGHRAPNVEARYLAAVLACGDSAVLIGPAAGRLYELTRGLFPEPHVAARTERRIRGIRTRRVRELDQRDVTTCRGIPITTVARTLVDMAGQLAASELARAVHEAGVRYHTSARQIREALGRKPNAPGARKLRWVVDGDEPVLLSRLESRFRRLLRESGLPLPATNRKQGSGYVDCRWENPPLTVELDSYRFHNSRHAWEQDRRREREARARGDYRRYTYGDVYEEPGPMLVELEQLLQRRTSATIAANRSARYASEKR